MKHFRTFCGQEEEHDEHGYYGTEAPIVVR